MITFEVGTFTLGTLIGIILGAFIGHALAIHRGKFQVKHNAAIELKKLFNPTIVKINNGESPTIMVSAIFYKQQEAAQYFSAYLKGRKLIKYNLAINAYSNWFKIMCNRSAAEVLYGHDSPEYLLAQSQNPVELMENILKYAKT